ncbi:MAG: hypothetical protein IJK66_06030 [Bacilli bacterium]|nr:hypothetical protein [Bacilli bacterium]
MNKLRLVFKRIGRFFDKRLITPISKLVLWFSEKSKNLGKSFEKMFSRKSSLIVVSLLIAVGIFYYVDAKSTIISQTSAEVLYNQKVNAIYNEELYSIEGIPETVDITMIGRRSDLYLAKQLPIDTVDVDLKDLKPGTHDVSLKYKGAINSVNYKIDPSIATVIIYPKMSEARLVNADIVNQDKLNSKLSISKVELDRKEVIIKGPQYKLDQVATVKALIDVNKIDNPSVGTIELSDPDKIELVAYDKKGIIIDVEIVPNTIKATVEITSPSKVVPVNIIPEGKVAFGKAISNITSSVESVTIYANEDVLSNIKSIDVPANVDGLESAKRYNLNIKKPSGVREMSETTTTVNITVESEASKELENIQLEYKNLPDNYSVNAASTDDMSVTVVVKGVKSVLESITEDSVHVYVDLKDYKAGTHDVDVIVEGNDVRATYEAKVKTVSLILSQKR